MYKLTTSPLERAGAISERNNGEITVSPPLPRPPQILAKSMKPYIPEEKTCIRIPLPQIRMKKRQHLSRPNLSLMATASKEPNAAPRTPNEVIFAVRFARPDALLVQFLARRLKSDLKLVSVTDALKPPSSYPATLVNTLISRRRLWVSSCTFGYASNRDDDHAKEVVPSERSHADHTLGLKGLEQEWQM
jgi:hypothetical protein